MSWAVLIGMVLVAVFYGYTGRMQFALVNAGLIGLVLYAFRGLFRKMALATLPMLLVICGQRQRTLESDRRFGMLELMYSDGSMMNQCDVMTGSSSSDIV